MPEAEARMVEAMYERTKGRVVVGSGLSEEFPVNIGLRQGSALSPLLYHGDGNNQQEDQHEGYSLEDDVCRRSGHNSRKQTKTTGVGGMEGGVREARTENQPREDISDMDWTPEREVEHQVEW